MRLQSVSFNADVSTYHKRQTEPLEDIKEKNINSFILIAL